MGLFTVLAAHRFAGRMGRMSSCFFLLGFHHKPEIFLWDRLTKRDCTRNNLGMSYFVRCPEKGGIDDLLPLYVILNILKDNIMMKLRIFGYTTSWMIFP